MLILKETPCKNKFIYTTKGKVKGVGIDLRFNVYNYIIVWENGVEETFEISGDSVLSLGDTVEKTLTLEHLYQNITPPLTREQMENIVSENNGKS